MNIRGWWDRVSRALKRLFKRKRRFEINTRRPEIRELIASICADGDFALRVYRPDFTIKELREI